MIVRQGSRGNGSNGLSEPTLEDMVEPGELQTESNSSRKRVLVVDDNPDVATSFALLLEALGHRVEVANEGRSALRIAERLRPHVAFLDIALPDMNGYELAARLREQQSQSMLLVAVSGTPDESTGRPDKTAFDRYLTKPADIEMLEEILAKA
jgi:CheY-like chemotaxis protein